MSPVDRVYRDYSEERFPLPTNADVVALEQRISVNFPEDYREFILDYNGGLFTEPIIAPPDPECPQDRLTFLHGIGATHPTVELGQGRELALWDDNDPPQIVPIGYTIMGNFILLVTVEEDRGTILLRSFSESYYLADTIWDFFTLLKTPEDHEDGKNELRPL